MNLVRSSWRSSITLWYSNLPDSMFETIFPFLHFIVITHNFVFIVIVIVCSFFSFFLFVWGRGNCMCYSYMLLLDFFF